MKIALVKAQDSAKTFKLTAVQYPINIGYLASACQAAGHDVEMWDFCVEPFSEAYIRSKLEQFKPDVVGVSCVTPAMYYGHEIAAVTKQVNPGIYTIVGGIHVSALPVETLEEFPHFDLGIIAEAEHTLLEVLKRIEKKQDVLEVPGTVYRKNGSILRAARPAEMPDVNAIPFPNRDLIPFHMYRGKHALRGFSRQAWNIIEMDTSRGCPYSCTFCGIDVTHGKGVRFRTPENVFAEIETCIKKYGTNFVVFNDSTFTIRKERAMEIVRHLPKMGIKGYAMNAHVNTVDEEMIETFASTGCKKISFGVESGSEKTLRAIRKNSTQKKIISAFELAHKSKIPTVEGTFIIGADIRETEKEVKETEDLIKIIRPDILALGIITPYPGTPQYVELKNMGYLKGVRWDDFQIFCETPPPWRTVSFSAGELVRRRNAILKSYIWTPRFMLNRLRVIRSLAELFYYVKMAFTFFRVVIKAGPERFEARGAV